MADQITTSLAQAKVLVMEGQKGETGNTPELSIGAVETLSPGSNATATLSGTADNPILNLGIPRGANGADGQDATGFALLTMDENSRVDYNNAPITGAEVIALAAEKNAVFLWDEDNGRLYAFNGEQAGAAVFYYPMSGGNGCMLQILAANETETTDAWNPVLPPVTAADNGKVLGVVNGAWAKKADEGGSAVTVDDALSSTSENPVQNKVINSALAEKGTYSKPSGGIPASDLAQAVQTSLGKADTAVQPGELDIYLPNVNAEIYSITVSGNSASLGTSFLEVYSALYTAIDTLFFIPVGGTVQHPTVIEAYVSFVDATTYTIVFVGEYNGNRYTVALSAASAIASPMTGTLTVEPLAELPIVTASDNGKFLRVVSGAWAAQAVPSAESSSFGGGS